MGSNPTATAASQPPIPAGSGAASFLAGRTPDIALRGPWTTNDLGKVAPTARDLSRGLPGYAIGFPGDSLDPGCSYEKCRQDLGGLADDGLRPRGHGGWLGGAVLLGLSLLLAQAASVSALVEIDAGRPVGVRRAYGGG